MNKKDWKVILNTINFLVEKHMESSYVNKFDSKTTTLKKKFDLLYHREITKINDPKIKS